MRLINQLDAWDSLCWEAVRYQQEVFELEPWRVLDLARERLIEYFPAYGSTNWRKDEDQTEGELLEEQADCINYVVMQRHEYE